MAGPGLLIAVAQQVPAAGDDDSEGMAVDEATQEFRDAFRRFLDELNREGAGRAGHTELLDRLGAHLGVPLEGLPVVAEQFASYDWANVDRALAAAAARRPGSSLVGVSGAQRRFHTLSELIEASERHGLFGIGSVDYAQVPVGVDSERTCVRFGLHLLAGRPDADEDARSAGGTPSGSDGTGPVVVLLRGPDMERGEPVVGVEVLCRDATDGRRLLAELRGWIAAHNLYSGQVISLEGHDFGEGIGPFRFHRRARLTRDDVVLPATVLDRIERQVVAMSRHRDAMAEAGQHLRRGVLLYGPPGTGKTHTARWLVASLPDVTVVLLAGASIAYISQACALARMLQPALVVLEDCDLVAASRDYAHENPLLFQVLNEMDGLAADADVAFLLTTNRADLLEPALAQRPGRVDLAVEIPLPDAEARARLLRLYGEPAGLPASCAAEVVARTAGTTASFIRELVRRAVLGSVVADAGAVTDEHVAAALDEMLSAADALTRRLLGADRGAAHPADEVDEVVAGDDVGVAAPAVYPHGSGWSAVPGLAPRRGPMSGWDEA